MGLKKVFGELSEEILTEIIGVFLLVTLGKKFIGKDQDAKGGEVGHQRMPNAFGIGQDDEAIFEALRQHVDVDKRLLVDLVVDVMEKHEKTIFRIILAKMPCGAELEDIPAKDPQKEPTTKRTSWEFTKKDLRVKYLENLADEVSKAGGNEEAAKRIVASMKARGLITHSWFAEVVHWTWSEVSKWVEANARELFDVESLDKITLAKVAEVLNAKAGQAAGYVNTLADMVRDRPVADMNLGFWRHTFRYHKVQAWALIAGIILTVAFFAIVSFNS